MLRGLLLPDGDSGTEDRADDKADDEDDSHENQAHSPGLVVLVVVWAGGVDIDAPRDRVHRRLEVGAVELVSEGGEEQWRRLAGDAGEGEHNARDNPGQGGGEHDAEHGAPAWRAECVARLLERPGDQEEHLLANTGDDWDKDDRKGDRPGDSREVALAQDNQSVDEEADR